VAQKLIRPQQRVVVISTAHGLKFAEQKTAYHLGQLEGINSQHANRPTESDADLPHVMDAIRRFADKTKILES
jgi:threonine synthase